MNTGWITTDKNQKALRAELTRRQAENQRLTQQINFLRDQRRHAEWFFQGMDSEEEDDDQPRLEAERNREMWRLDRELRIANDQRGFNARRIAEIQHQLGGL